MIFTDTFTRSDGPIGSPWVTDRGAYSITSGEAHYDNDLIYPADVIWSSEPFADMNATATVDVGSADMVVEWDYDRHGSLLMRPVFRYAGPGSMLGLVDILINPDEMRLVSIDEGGSNTTLWSGAVTGWQSQRIRIQTRGTSIDCWTNDVHRFNVTSSFNQSATKAGLGGYRGGWDPQPEFTDTFSGSLGPEWDVVGGSWGTSSGDLVAVLPPSPPPAYFGAVLTDTGSPVQSVEWDLSGVGSATKNGIYLAFRGVDDDNYWFVTGSTASAGHIAVYRRAGGSNVRMSSWATGVSWGGGQTVRVEATTSTITVKVSGSTVITLPYSTVDPWPRAGVGGYAGAGNLASARVGRIQTTPSPSVSELLAGVELTGPWITDGRWTRFHCRPFRRPTDGWSVGFLKF